MQQDVPKIQFSLKNSVQRIINQTLKMAQAKRKDKAKKRVVIVEPVGQIHIKASFNNIIISITNTQGQVISWASAGKMGFKCSKKNTPYAAQTAASNCAAVAVEAGMKKAEVFVKGPGAGRESAIRTVANAGIEVLSIKDITPLPHNGCRPPKRRRVQFEVVTFCNTFKKALRRVISNYYPSFSCFQ